MVHIQFHFLLSGFYDCVKPDCLNAVSVRKGEWKMIFKHGLRQPVLFLSTTLKQSGWCSSMDRILNMVCISLLLWGGPTKSFLNRIGSNSTSPLPVLGTGHSPGHTVWSSCGHAVWSFDYFRPVGAFLCGLSFVSVGHKKSVEQENAPTRREVAPADQLNDRNDAVFLKGQVAGKKMGGNVFSSRFSETANQLKEPLWMCGMLDPLQVQTHILKAGDQLTRDKLCSWIVSNVFWVAT